MKKNNIEMVLVPRDVLESVFAAMHKAEYCHWGYTDGYGDYEDYPNETLFRQRCFTSSSPEWKAIKKALNK